MHAENIKAMEEITSENSSLSRLTYILKGEGADKYYGISCVFFTQNESEQRLLVLYPRSSAWRI